MPKLFEITVSAVFLDNENRVLLLKKNSGDRWMLPGGRVEENETWEEGLRREIKEETGIENFSIKKITDVDTSDSKKSIIITCYCKIVATAEIRLSSEHPEYLWARKDDLDALNFWHEKIRERLKKLF